MNKVLIAFGSLVSVAVFVPGVASAQPSGMFQGMRAGVLAGGGNWRPLISGQLASPRHLSQGPRIAPGILPGLARDSSRGGRITSPQYHLVPGPTGSSSQGGGQGGGAGVHPGISAGGQLSSAGAAYYGGFYYGPTPNSYYGSLPYVSNAGSDACDLVRVRKPTSNGGYRYVVVRQCELSQAR
jgi:hypothetical protein